MLKSIISNSYRSKMRKQINQFEDFDGFSVKVQFDEDNHYLAYIFEMPTISAFAKTKQNAINELHTVWQMVKQSYKESHLNLPLPANNKIRPKLIGNLRVKVR